MAQNIGKQAVVIGAGLGGLAAARALSDHFENVIVLERDELPRNANFRPGTPQCRHTHALQVGGARALSDLFPGFEEQLKSAGAVVFDIGSDFRMEPPGYDAFPRRKLDLYFHSASRPLIEFVARQMLQQRPNVALRENHRVHDIVTTADGTAVRGLNCETGEGLKETISADLVVDASGRGALTLELLKSLGRSVPDETSIGMDIGYSTARYEIPNDSNRDWKAVVTFAEAPRSSRGAFLFPLEGNQWIVTLQGMHGDKPPGDWEGFESFARELRTKTVFDAISRAKRIGDVHRFTLPASVLRHFERLESFPRGLLPLGDAVCRFNPVFAQGMSVAAIEASYLRRLLSAKAEEPDPLAGLAASYFAEVQEIIKTPWSVAYQDLIYPETSGVRPPDLEATLRFGRGVMKLASRDPAVHKLMIEVRQLLKPNSVFREPNLARRVQEVLAEA